MAEINANSVLTLIQALHLVGLIPSLFVIFFLSTLLRRNVQAIVPVLYFVVLSAIFALPLVGIYAVYLDDRWFGIGQLLAENTLVAISFLLILQFMTGRIPSVFYWLVLMIPLLGAGMLATVQGDEVCLSVYICYDIATFKTLYSVFSSSLVFLLLMYYASRFSGHMQQDADRKHKYALIVALILLNLFVLAIELARLSGKLPGTQADFIIITFRLTFIYLVITSLFRVFYPTLAGQVINPSIGDSPHDPSADMPHVEKIRALLDEDRVYREMRMNRAGLAERVGISEYALSRIINHYFGKNFSELMNGYRIEEAKKRLREEPNYQITLIGFEVGFNSIASFNRVFKDMVGVSPTEWRSNSNTRNTD
ncbi:MAG: helix-turn-helix domain-containing protein [Rickettsiales bacterium]